VHDNAKTNKEHIMSEAIRRGQSSGEFISLEQAREVEHWTKALGVSKEMLQEAIREVGNSAGRVRQYLSHAGAVM
jgi:Protein of unknown function (DUF3606)